MMKPTELILYSTLGCHLCEQAVALSLPLLESEGIALREVDIADDDALMEAYGIRIPVLREQSSGAELGWPFDAVQLRSWLQSLRVG